MGDIYSIRCELSTYKFMYSVSQCMGDKCKCMAGGRLVAQASQGLACPAIDKRDALYILKIFAIINAGI